MVGEYIELQGSLNWSDPPQDLFTACPVSGGEKSIFCPHVVECALPRLIIAAKTPEDAVEFAQIAQLEGDLPDCLAGKRYKIVDPIANFRAISWREDRAIDRHFRKAY